MYILQKTDVFNKTKEVASTTNYLQAVVEGQNVTFKMDQDGAYAFGVAAVASTDNNNQNDNNQNSNGTSGTTSGTTGGTSTTGTVATGSTKTASGTSTGGSTSTVSTGVVQTGDTIPGEMAATAFMILAALAVLAVLNKKRMTL